MESNMSFTIGNFKGTGKVNGLPVFLDKLPVTIGGVMGPIADIAPAKFGRLVSVDIDAPTIFKMGYTAGDVPVGILIADPAIMQHDPAMNDKYYEGRPATAIAFGLFQLLHVDAGFSVGRLGMNVWADRVTGEIGFWGIGQTPAPVGADYVQLNAAVFSKDGPNGTTVWLNNPIVTQVAWDAMPTVTTPIASPGAGAVASGTPVTLFCMTPGAVIHYTIDGSVPDNTDPVFNPASPVIVTAGVTVRAIAIFPGFINSAGLSAAYTVA